MRSALSALLIAALTVGAVRAQAIDGVTIQVPPDLSSHHARLTAAAEEALAVLSGWFGPMPSTPLTVIGTRWQGADAGSSRPGAVSVPVRWLSPVRDQSMERALIAALVEQYWQADSRSPFHEALREYIAIRAIHQILEGSNFAAPRFFGGHVSFPLRSVLLSPPVGDPRPRVWLFGDTRDHHARELEPRLRALLTLERLVGWPTMLQALSSMRASGPEQWTEPAFGETLSTMMGIDLRILVQQCFSRGLECSFATMDGRLVDSVLTEASLPIADGTSALDTPRYRLGLRLALNWLAWLQNAMLSYTAVV